jgi:hypothetical protein
VLDRSNSGTMKRRINYSPEPLETAPTLSFLAIEGWACSVVSLTWEEGK